MKLKELNYLLSLVLTITIVSFSFTISTDKAFSITNLDRDNDGVLDEFDECPRVTETYNRFQDEDGCPDSIIEEKKAYQFPDSDGDGIEDRRDSCVFIPESYNDYLDYDGCPEILPNQTTAALDYDSDGILDAVDQCPLDKETFNGFKDADGCPDSLLPTSDGLKDSTSIENPCLHGKIPVLRINTLNTVCVYQDTANKWELLGIGEILIDTTTDEEQLPEPPLEPIEEIPEPSAENKLEVIHVDGNVSVLIGIDQSLEGNVGGNIGVSAGPDGLLIIDDGLAFALDDINEQLMGLKTCDTCGSVEFLLNTHWHEDHVANNAHFGEHGTKIIAHSNVRELLSHPQEMMAFDMTFDAHPKEALPVLTYDDSVSVHFNDEEIKVIHLPNGHTNSDSIIYFTDSNVLHLGDHFFNGMYPFIDLEHGGSILGLTANVEKIINEYPEDVKIIPGHGQLASMGDLIEYHTMLVDTTTIIQEQIDEGKTLEEIQDAGLPEEWKNWEGVWIDEATWILIVYTSLSIS